jgi:hypothetical protein
VYGYSAGVRSLQIADIRHRQRVQNTVEEVERAGRETDRCGEHCDMNTLP